MKKIYFMYILLCAFLISPNSHSSNTKEKLPVKKSESGNYYVSSTTDPGWSYTCTDGIEVELLSVGLKNNIPASIDISDLEIVDRIVVEIVYKGNNPGETIEIEDADGNSYPATRVVPSGGSSSVWYYRTEMPITSSINYSNTLYASTAQSMLAYVFRRVNNGIGSSGVFTAIGGYNNIETLTIPITTDSGPRGVTVELPISELTDDGRYIHIEVSAADGSFEELTETINDFPSGNCCIKVFSLSLQNVAGNIDEIEVKIDTRNKQNGQTVNGQSWVMGGAVKTDVHCSCVDFDTTPPTADNLVDHIILEDISLMPKITFSDECSAVTLEAYNEYQLGFESCWIDLLPNTVSNIEFDGFPFDNLHHWEYGYYQELYDTNGPGPSKIIGRVVNNTDPTSGWIIEIFFEPSVDNKADIDFSKPYKLEGFGDYKGSSLTLDNTSSPNLEVGPVDPFGFNPIMFNVTFGGSVNGKIEMSAVLNNCVIKREVFIIREWIVSDAAGNSQVYIQRVELEYN
jgi:hypothetical protein